MLDTNRDGQVTLTDLETLAVKYLCGSGVLTKQPFDRATNKKKLQFSTSSYHMTSTGSQFRTNNNGTNIESEK